MSDVANNMVRYVQDATNSAKDLNALMTEFQSLFYEEYSDFTLTDVEQQIDRATLIDRLFESDDGELHFRGARPVFESWHHKLDIFVRTLMQIRQLVPESRCLALEHAVQWLSQSAWSLVEFGPGFRDPELQVKIGTSLYGARNRVSESLRELEEYVACDEALRTSLPTDLNDHVRTNDVPSNSAADIGGSPVPKGEVGPNKPKTRTELATCIYEWAIGTIPDADKMTIGELHNAIMCHPEATVWLLEALPDNPATFGTYLKRGGIDRYDSLGARRRRQSRRPKDV